MGRKIPGKKHRGVKDPIKQQLERKQKLKLVINAPPSNPNIQEIPKSILELSRLRDLAKTAKNRKRKRKNGNLIDTGNLSTSGPQIPGMNQKDSAIPRLKQKPGESDTAFLHRLDLATAELLNEAQMEVKHSVVVNRDNTGNIVSVKPHRPADNLKTPITIRKMSKETNSTGVKGSKRNNLERLKMKNELKKALKKGKVNDDLIEKKFDYVQFGEVAHAPPQINRRPRGCDSAACERPGRKDLFLARFTGISGVGSINNTKLGEVANQKKNILVSKNIPNSKEQPKSSFEKWFTR